MRRALAVLAVATGCTQILGLSDPTLMDVRPDAAPGADAAVPVFVTVIVNGGGQVTSTPPGIDCPGACTMSFKKGAQLRLNAYPNGGSSLTGWDPACGTEATCVLTPANDLVVTTTFKDNGDGHNFVFVTREEYDPSTFAPLSQADALCNASAAAARLPGTYVAWLSNSSVNAKDRIPADARGWVRPDGLPFTDRVADLVVRRIYYPPRLDASGGSDERGALPATGTDSNGMRVSETCKGWTSSTPGDKFQLGDPAGSWTNSGTGDCSLPARLYCFGTTKSKPVEAPKATGRIAFLSRTSLPAPLGGIAKADELCANDARDAGLPGTFKALLSMNGVAAASRFNAGGLPWVRPDGVVIAVPGTTLLDGGLLQAGISQTAFGTYFDNYRCAAGSDNPRNPGTPATTCNDWTVLDDSQGYQTAHGTARNWWASFIAPCHEYCPNCLGVICLQE